MSLMFAAIWFAMSFVVGNVLIWGFVTHPNPIAAAFDFVFNVGFLGHSGYHPDASLVKRADSILDLIVYGGCVVIVLVRIVRHINRKS
ncbi:MAG: hypothetical protein WA435_06655 [Gallionellaceae bacterium]